MSPYWLEGELQSNVQNLRFYAGVSLNTHTPAAGGVQEDIFYPLDQLLHVWFPTFLPCVVQD